MTRVMKSYWDRYAAQRRAERSQTNLRGQRGVGVRRATTPARRPR